MRSIERSIWDLNSDGIKEGSLVDSNLNRFTSTSDLWLIQSINCETGIVTILKVAPEPHEIQSRRVA